MGQIRVEKNVGGIEGLCVITPAVHGDARGYFMETYSERDMREAGIDVRFVQDNQSMSVRDFALLNQHQVLQTILNGYGCCHFSGYRHSSNFQDSLPL